MIRVVRHCVRPVARVTWLIWAAALGGCADNAYYVKSDADIGIPAELGALDLSLLADHPLEVAATFKSDGVIQPQDSDTLYGSIATGLHHRGIYHMRRYAVPAGDVSLPIAQLEPPQEAAPEKAEPAPADATPLAPRLLVLVENHPDLSRTTRTRYFFSGFVLGSWSPNRSTDRYDVTVAYRDPQGEAHVYRSHQELILSTGTHFFDRDGDGTAGMRRYSDPVAAFGGVIANSLDGPGRITVGKPRDASP